MYKTTKSQGKFETKTTKSQGKFSVQVKFNDKKLVAEMCNYLIYIKF